MAQLLFLESAKFAVKNGCVHEIEDLLGLRPHGILTNLLEEINRKDEGTREEKHRNDKGNKDDMYPNLEGSKIWDVLSLLFDVGRGISKEERRLYLNGCLKLARQVRQRLTNLKNMVYKVIKG